MENEKYISLDLDWDIESFFEKIKKDMRAVINGAEYDDRTMVNRDNIIMTDGYIYLEPEIIVPEDDEHSVVLHFGARYEDDGARNNDEIDDYLDWYDGSECLDFSPRDILGENAERFFAEVNTRLQGFLKQLVSDGKLPSKVLTEKTIPDNEQTMEKNYEYTAHFSLLGRYDAPKDSYFQLRPETLCETGDLQYVQSYQVGPHSFEVMAEAECTFYMPRPLTPEELNKGENLEKVVPPQELDKMYTELESINAGKVTDISYNLDYIDNYDMRRERDTKYAANELQDALKKFYAVNKEYGSSLTDINESIMGMVRKETTKVKQQQQEGQL